MGVTAKDVEHIADLAHLSLSQDEKKRYQGQLSKIIEYFDTLQHIPDKEEIGDWTGPKDQLPLRNDHRSPSLPVEKAIGNAQEIGKEHFRVPRVIERD